VTSHPRRAHALTVSAACTCSDVGKELAERRVSFKSALPQLMFALATGANPADKTKAWAGSEMADAASAKPTALESRVVTRAKPPKEAKPGGMNAYFEAETSSEEEVSKITGMPIFKQERKKKKERVVALPDADTAGKTDYSRAQGAKDAALLDAGVGVGAGAGAGAGAGDDE
jgi:hypothetical protein